MSEWHRAVVERHDGECLLIEAGTRLECTVALDDWVRENWVEGDSAYVCKVNYYVIPDGIITGHAGRVPVEQVLERGPGRDPALPVPSKTRTRRDATGLRAGG